MSEYNGHPSWEHWQAALWFGNDEGLYSIARSFDEPRQLWEFCKEAFTETPDGAVMTYDLAEYAWRSVDEDREEA